MTSPFKLSLIAAACTFALNTAYADSTSLTEVVVDAGSEQKQVTEIKKNRRAIQDELINDAKDLVRYTTDVGISDNGRHNRGFAMRGVESNRVGISVDGIALPNSEDNSLYSRYGNFNNSRLTVDPEFVREIEIMRGADSFNAGSGSLGGGVNYRTLEGGDIVFPENKVGGLLKSGYASKNREWVNTVGVGYKDDQAEAIFLYSHRRGHELKSLGRGEDIIGNDRGIPDPAEHRNNSYLAKVGYFLNENHRLSASLNTQENNNYTDEKSYTFLGLWREAEDIGKRYQANLAYEYFPTEGKLAYAKVDYDYQKTELGAINYKGGYRFSDRSRSLTEVADRRVNTEFHRITLRLDGQPINTEFGTHHLSLKSAVSHHSFENENNDFYILSEGISKVANSIQHPVKSYSAMISLQDKIQWNEVFSNELGGRYDFDKLIPQALKLYCRACGDTPKASKFHNANVSLITHAQLNDTWKISHQLSSGYRVPTASEMYFSFLSSAGSWLANPNLKSEQSVNNSISIQANNELGYFNTNVYHIQYKDFLFEHGVVAYKRNEYYDECSVTYGCAEYNPAPYHQMINVDKARISGFELSGKLNLEQIAHWIPTGFKVMGSLGYSKGKLYGTEESMLSIQPMKAIVGLSYEDPQDRFGIHSRWTYLGSKKAKDAKIMDAGVVDLRNNVIDYPFLNGSATLFDLYGFVKVGKHITLRAGIYNLFNRKYHTWDVLRGLNLRSTTNSVDIRDPKGLERYYAPGRNFAASAEIRF